MSCEPTLSQCQNYVVRTNGGGCHHCNALCTYAESVLGILCRIGVRNTMPNQCQDYYAESVLGILCRISVRTTMPNQCYEYYAESVSGLLCRISVRTTMLYEPARVSCYIYVSYIDLMSEQLCCVNLCRITLTYDLC